LIKPAFEGSDEKDRESISALGSQTIFVTVGTIGEAAPSKPDPSIFCKGEMTNK